MAHLEQVFVSPHGFSGTQKKMSTRFHCAGDARHDVAPAILREIDEDIAAEHDVEPAQHVEGLEQVEFVKGHPFPVLREQFDTTFALAK